jgi:hypothetical protein
MKLMSEEGVSSVAVLDEDSGALLSAVSVTDIGKVGSDKPNSELTNLAYSLLDCCSISEQPDFNVTFASIDIPNQGTALQNVSDG